MKHEIEYIVKSKEYLAENKIKNEIEQLLLKYKHRNNINSGIIKPHKLVPNFSQRVDVLNFSRRSSNKNAALQNLCIYYTWKNIRKQYKSSKYQQYKNKNNSSNMK